MVMARKYVSQKVNFAEDEYIVTWIPADEVAQFSPITQVYAVVFNNSGKILICRKNGIGNWQIPGGSPEEGETIKDTLKRELMEEVDVEVTDIRVLGGQKVVSTSGYVFYQLRCVARVEKLLPQTLDPADNVDWERKFVPASKINEYIKWGRVGRKMFSDAIDLWKENNEKN